MPRPGAGTFVPGATVGVGPSGAIPSTPPGGSFSPPRPPPSPGGTKPDGFLAEQGGPAVFKPDMSAAEAEAKAQAEAAAARAASRGGRCWRACSSPSPPAAGLALVSGMRRSCPALLSCAPLPSSLRPPSCNPPQDARSGAAACWAACCRWRWCRCWWAPLSAQQAPWLPSRRQPT